MPMPGTNGRPIGRPRSDELTDRFLTVGTQLAITRGPHRINSDVLTTAAHAGKAGFYRRWVDIDAFLAGVLRYAFRNPVELTGATLAEDLAAVVDRHVNGETGAVCAVLAGRAPFSAPLSAAWGGTGGPRDFLFLDVESAARRHGLGGYGSPTVALANQLDQVVTWLRGVRLSNGLAEVSAELIAGHVQARLDGWLVPA